MTAEVLDKDKPQDALIKLHGKINARIPAKEEQPFTAHKLINMKLMRFTEHAGKSNTLTQSNLHQRAAAQSVILVAALVLSACTKSPAEQCLESFRDDLVSPRSAKAVKLVDGNLTYLAKNRSGTEIQGKAVCLQIGDRWMRDSASEYLRILKYSNDSYEENHNCKVKGSPSSYCDEMHPKISLEIARIRLGYN